jgi:hypothetical protein
MPVKLEVPETPVTAPSAPAPRATTPQVLPRSGELGSWTDVVDAEPDDPAVLSLEGTCWLGEDVGASGWRFDPGGVFTYGARRPLYSNGTWKQKGRRFYTETNRCYAERLGTVDGDQLTGEFRNVASLATVFTMRRVSDAEFEAALGPAVPAAPAPAPASPRARRRR